MEELRGERIRLRTAEEADLDALVAIRRSPEVFERWRGGDIEAEVLSDLRSSELKVMSILDEDGTVVGAIQWHEVSEPDYRHAGIDIYLDPASHGRGLCTDALRTLARYLFDELEHHRITIDPAVDNEAAIRCYTRAGFREVGVMRQYERGLDGTWHDCLLMELLATDLA